MITDSTPSQVHPDLTNERLSILARVITDVRLDAAETHEPDKGDTAWGFGTRACERQIHAIRKASEVYPWLRIINPGRQFVFQIGAVPARIYKGTPSHPRFRTLQQTYPEIRAQQAAFAGIGYDRDWLWRLVIETHPDGTVDQVWAVQIAQDTKRWETNVVWAIPLSTPVKKLTALADPRPGKELPAVPVRLKSRKKKSDVPDGQSGSGAE